MKRHGLISWCGLLLLGCSLWVGSLAQAQTQVVAPKNNFPLEEDLKRGREAAQYWESQSPVINDAEIARFIQMVGARLIAAIPPEYRQPAFQFSFKVLENQELNAFALPGGPMYVHSALVHQAASEGELAGVLAHEISHVLLRHGTARSTRQQDNQTETVADILSDPVISDALGNLGGVVVGSQVLANRSYLNVYEREDETQSDVLGAQILARAGYDPRDMVRMLQLLKRLGGSGPIPPWLKGHPDLDERIARVTREITPLPVPRTPFATGQFSAVQARLRRLVPPKESAPAARAPAPAPAPARPSAPAPARPSAPAPAPTTPAPTRAPAGYQARVPLPSARLRTVANNTLSISVPENWVLSVKGTSGFFAPSGAYGDQGLTHGIMLGLYRDAEAKDAELLIGTLKSVMRANAYLQPKTAVVSATLGGREGFTLNLSGTSPVTQRATVATLYLVPMNKEEAFYLLTVVPQEEASAYQDTWAQIINALRLDL